MNPTGGVQEFSPTLDEMDNFEDYILKLENEKGAHLIGLAKIIPPKEWQARKGGKDRYDGNDVKSMMIWAPAKQVVSGAQGCYTQMNLEQRRMTVREYEKMAMSARYCPPAGKSTLELERNYWKNIVFSPAIYGADVSGSITDKDQKRFNISRLGTILDKITTKIEGVTTPYLYWGMWKTAFPWHTEDLDLYSINLVHYGASKYWYVVPPKYAKKFERVASNFFPASSSKCPAFLRHKETIMTPTLLHRYGIPVYKMEQKAGEFIITFPMAYHAGFNMGYNCAESTNFATPRWIDYGKVATRCFCRLDTVRICMDEFVRLYQPEKYNAWMESKGKLPRADDDADQQPSTSGTAASSKVQVSKRYPLSKKRPAAAAGLRGSAVGSGKSKVTTTKKPKMEETAAPYLDPDLFDSEIDEEKPAVEVPAKNEEKPVVVDLSAENLLNPFSGMGCYIDPRLSSANDFQQPAALDLPSTSTVRTKGALKAIPLLLSSSVMKNPEGSSAAEINPALNSMEALWAKDPVDVDAESQFNMMESSFKPHCCVCQYFVRRSTAERVHLAEIPGKSQRLIGDLAFGKDTILSDQSFSSSQFSTGSDLTVDAAPIPGDTGEDSLLLTCTECHMTVHAACYGLDPDDESVSAATWRCIRCSRQCTEATCKLCCLRGGALQPTGDDQWCHVVCALLQPEATFIRYPCFPSIDLSRMKLNQSGTGADRSCKYCGFNTGAFVECSVHRCGQRFHVTCGFRNGGIFQRHDWPTLHAAFCTDHDDSGPFMELNPAVGELVWIKRDTGLQQLVEVQSWTRVLYCVADFDKSQHAGPWSCNDFYLEDIVKCSCCQTKKPKDGTETKKSTHERGGRIEVRWTETIDGEEVERIYEGTFVAAREAVKFSVVVKKGSAPFMVERDQLRRVHETKIIRPVSDKETSKKSRRKAPSSRNP